MVILESANGNKGGGLYYGWGWGGEGWGSRRKEVRNVKSFEKPVKIQMAISTKQMDV